MNQVQRTPESNKQNRQIELQINPASFVISTILILKTTFRLQKARVCPTSFAATFVTVFPLIY